MSSPSVAAAILLIGDVDLDARENGIDGAGTAGETIAIDLGETVAVSALGLTEERIKKT